MSKEDLERRSYSQLRGLEYKSSSSSSCCSSKGTAAETEFSTSKIGISSDVMEVDKSEGVKTGEGGISSRRAMRVGDDGAGRIVDWLNRAVIAMVICTADLVSQKP